MNRVRNHDRNRADSGSGLNDPARVKIRHRAVVAGVLLIVILIAFGTLPLTRWLDAAGLWIQANPATGGAIFLVIFAAGGALMIPGSLLTMSGGYLFGLYGGVVLVSIGSALGAVAACFVSRNLAREWLAQKFESDPRFHAIDTAIESRGLFIVLLTRLSLLIPYNVLNMVFGLTRVPYRTLMFGTWIGMLPAVVLYVYLGSIAKNVGQLISGELQAGMAGRVLFLVGLAAVVVATAVIHRTATRALKRELGEY